MEQGPSFSVRGTTYQVAARSWPHAPLWVAEAIDHHRSVGFQHSSWSSYSLRALRDWKQFRC